jgi:phosphoribosylaminoimidazolecarboxamide formyltransferase/IMP cyclohydrolase
LAVPSDAAHHADLVSHGITPFQLVVVNLYPFEATVADDDVSDAAAVEEIDIGGPAMIRAAAKNHAWVTVVVSPEHYDEVASAVEAGGPTAEMRRRLATAAFATTAAYDAAILGWLQRNDPLPPRLALSLERIDELRYGENPHQPAALYRRRGGRGWWDGARQLQGKPMSFNNVADAEAAWRLATAFAEPGVVIVKHTNPCGAAVCDTIESAFRKAWDCDPVSAFGGVIAVNRPLDGRTAAAIATHFVEVVIAPGVTDEAAAALAGRGNVRLLEAAAPSAGGLDMRMVEDGFLVQVRDDAPPPAGSKLPEGWRVMAGAAPNSGLLAELEFAWVVAAATKSNAVVIARDRSAVGVGAGDQSRVGAAERALVRAGERSRDAVAASDAFLPFRDTLDLLAEAGIVALVEPGGSMRDDEVIAAAEERAMTLIFTGRRHFRH